ncbi:unnamed protein product [Camellia sinensis]
MANDSNGTGSSINRTESIERILERAVTNFLQALQTNINNGMPERREEPVMIKQFQDLKPIAFIGSSNPLIAEAWVRDMEKIFCALPCTESPKMDAFMMLMCCYQSTNVVYNPQPPHTYDKLVEFVCSKLKDLNPGELLFFYKMPGYNEFTLQNNVDMGNMLYLVRSFWLQIIDVVVKQTDDDIIEIQSHSQPVNGNDSPVRCNGFDNFDMDDEVDLLETFCPHNDKAFISESWARGFTHIGQQFEGSAVEFCNVLWKYAVQCGFLFNYVKNDSVQITAICAMSATKGYKWIVYARKLEANGTLTNRLVGSELVADIMAERIRDMLVTRPTEVMLNMKQDYGLDITYRVAWLGVEKARGELFGAHSISFDHLRWYSAAVMEHNPGSYITLEHDEQTHRFTRFFISFKACIDGFTHCRPLLFLDATFLKGRFKGFLLAATAKDGNQGLFPLAYAVVDSENTTNWSWFLWHLAHVLQDRPITDA